MVATRSTKVKWEGGLEGELSSRRIEGRSGNFVTSKEKKKEKTSSGGERTSFSH